MELATHLPIPLVRDALFGRFAVFRDCPRQGTVPATVPDQEKGRRNSRPF
jgi:hypothetical protein